MKIMDEILKVLFWEGKQMSAPAIARESGLKLSQVHRAIHDLKKRRLIIKEVRSEGGRGRKKPYVKLTDGEYIEKYLQERGLL